MMLHPEVLQMPHEVAIISDPQLDASSNDSFLSYNWMRSRQPNSRKLLQLFCSAALRVCVCVYVQSPALIIT